jgi:hypothetical protein
VSTPAAALQLVEQAFGSVRVGLGVGHLEDGRDAAEHGGSRSRLEIFLVFETRFTKVHL